MSQRAELHNSLGPTPNRNAGPLVQEAGKQKDYWWIKETSYRCEEIIPAKTDSLAMRVLYFLTISFLK